MLLKRVVLKNFRNVDFREFEFSPFLTIIIGENARGKTNLLESVYLITQGEGFRETREDELLKFETTQAVVQASFADSKEVFLFQIVINRIGETVEKNFSINKAKKKRIFTIRKKLLKLFCFLQNRLSL